MSEDKTKQLFIISPIGSEDSDTRIFFDKVMRHLIEPVGEQYNYEVVRADQLPRPGTITTQIIECLKEDDLVVADLSDLNPNVFYELAIRHAVDKPVIILAKKGTRIPFDLHSQRVIFYTLDPDDIKVAIEALKKQIETVESDNFVVDSPLTTQIQISTSKIVTDTELLERIFTMIKNMSENINYTEYVPQSFPEMSMAGSCSDAIDALLSTEWGKKPRSISELREAMEANVIVYPKTTLSGTLVWMVKKGKLRRWKDKNRGYLYQKIF